VAIVFTIDMALHRLPVWRQTIRTLLAASGFSKHFAISAAWNFQLSGQTALGGFLDLTLCVPKTLSELMT
jgi:hypothetical protein